MTMRKHVAMLLTSALLLLAACSQAPAVGISAGSASPTQAPWPDHYGEGEQGAWSTGPLTAGVIVHRARTQHANIRCVRSFIDAVGFERDITWDLYLRDGEWILTAHLDDAAAEPWDAGTYSMWHVEGKVALFTSVGRDFRNDYWLYPRFDGDQLTMNFVDLTQWQAGDDPACFVQAGATVEMTNTFERVA